jgi:hypothetical protein
LYEYKTWSLTLGEEYSFKTLKTRITGDYLDWRTGENCIIRTIRFSSPNIITAMKNEVEVGGVCNKHDGDETCSEKYVGKRPVWRHLRREDNIKVVKQSVDCI